MEVDVPEQQSKKIYAVFPPVVPGGEPRVVGFAAEEMVAHVQGAGSFYAIFGQQMVELGYRTLTPKEIYARYGSFEPQVHRWTYAVSVYGYDEQESINKGDLVAEVVVASPDLVVKPNGKVRMRK